MKAMRKYWLTLLLITVLTVVSVGLPFSGCGENTEDATSTEDYSERDPEKVTLSSDVVSSIMSALPEGFTETTDEQETEDTSTSGGTETDGNTDTKSDTDTATNSSGHTDRTDLTVKTDTTTSTDKQDTATSDTDSSVSSTTNVVTDTNTSTSTGSADTPDDPAVTGNIAPSSTAAAVAKGRISFPSYPKELKINGIKCAFDESSNTYCYTISERAVGVKGTYLFSGTHLGNDLSVVFPNGEMEPGGEFTPKENQTMKIRVFTDFYYKDYELRISIVPIMVIETENRTSLPTGSDKKTTLFCTIEIHNPDADIEPGDEFLASYATIHNRGASSLSYPKKSLKIELQKFVEEDGQSVMTERKKRMLGMRDDDDWILDACYADPTMMHNKMAYNLWEEIGGDTNPDAILAGPHCEYVEVIMNGKYHGLYLLVEPVDEKQMGVEKSEDTADGSHGVFIKTAGWQNVKFEAAKGTPYKSTTVGKSSWEGFEMHYPESNISAADWDPLYELLIATVEGDDKTFKEVASKYLSKENIVNYWIFISVTLARDNAGKNICWSIANRWDPNMKMYINAWDCDNTFGYRYGASNVGPIKDSYDTANYADKWFVLLRRYLECDVDGSLSYLSSRWNELTAAGGPCSTEGLQARITKEALYLERSGAFLREQKRWSATGSVHASLPNTLVTEVKYAKEWIKNRIPVVNQIVTKYCVKVSQ